MSELNVELIKAKDEEELKKLFTSVVPIVHRLARHYEQYALDEDEIVQDTVLTVFNNLHKYNPERHSLLAWCAFIAQNTIRRNLQREPLWSRHIIDKDVQEITDELTIPTSEEDYDLDSLRNAISQLPDKQRKIINALYVEGRNGQEVAKELNISAQAVYNLNHRALRLLKEILLSELALAELGEENRGEMK